jgi:hypothetical protein
MGLKRTGWKLWPLLGLLCAAPMWAADPIAISCPAQAGAGAAVQCPVSMNLNGHSIDSLAIGVMVTPNGAAPALTTGALTFADAIGGAIVNAGGTHDQIGAVWSFAAPLTANNVSLGTMTFTVPAGAIAGQSYTVTITGATAYLGVDEVPLTIGPAPIVTVPLLNQTITFNALANQPFGTAPFTVSATASSGLPVLFNSQTGTVCTATGTNGATITLLQVGTCTIRATQPGSGAYNPATPVDQGFAVTQGSQTITFNVLANQPFGTAPFTASATASSSLTVSFNSQTPAVCTATGTNGATITLLQVGTCTIRATQAGDSNWLAATPVDQPFQVTQASQTITFNALSNRAMGTGTFTVSATASSSLPVNFNSQTPAVCTATGTNGTTTTLLHIGTCTIQATQAGNANYAAAAPVSQGFTVTQGSQTITFNGLANLPLETAPFAVSATASSGLAVGFASQTTGICTTSGTNGATVTLVTVGQCTIQASQVGNADFSAATPVSQSFQVTAGRQTITFNALANQPFSTSPLTVSATASSGLTVSFNSQTAPVCTSTGTNGATITLLQVGTCTIQATQPGDGVNWAPATPVSRSFQVTQGSQTITFNALSNQPMGTAPFTVSATASSGLTVSFNSQTAAVCTSTGTNGATVTLLHIGTCTIRATQAGDSNWLAATPVDRGFQVTQGSQTITFNPLPNQPMGTAAFGVSATASSGLAVSFNSQTPTVCTATGANGATITLVQVGTCTVQATQAGNADYTAAAPVPQTFTVTQGSQTITFNALADQPMGTAPFTVSATASSGLAVSFASQTTGICTTSGTNGATVTLLPIGTCIIQASQAGNANFSAATPVSQSFQVTQGPQTISFGSVANKILSTGSFTVSASASSGLPVSFTSLTPAVCTVSGTTVTLVAQGACTLQASQAGNANFTAAPAVTQTFQVIVAVPVMTPWTLALTAVLIILLALFMFRVPQPQS